MNANPCLQASALSCTRQHSTLFTDLNFVLYPKELLLVQGANGAGKSSLLRLLTGLATPARGNITWNGENIASVREQYQHDLHYLGHDNGLKLHLTLQENLQLAAHLSLTTYAGFENILHALQLAPLQHEYAKNISAGQKRRLALAKIFLLPRKLWILDEPLTALDADTQIYFLSQLQMHLQQGGMAIISSHHAIHLPDQIIKNLRLSAC